MTPPIRPEVDPSAAIAALKAQGAPDEAIHAYLVSKGFQPVEPQEGVVARGLHGAAESLQQFVTHPVDSVVGMAKGAGHALMDAVLSPGIGEARHDPRLSKGGNSSGRPIETAPYDAEHGGITPQQRTAGGLQTVANLAFPGVAGKVAGRLGGGMLAKAAGLGTAGALAGAAQDPQDPAAGAVGGGLLAPIFGAAAHGAGAVGSSVADLVGRPMESRPLIQAGPVKIGRVEGVTDRAARLNAPVVSKAGPLPVTDKPLAPVDAGIPTQRLARGLKTSSPAAETVLQGALGPRAEAAVQRVIDHAKDLTGIKRANAFETTEQLKQRTMDESDANYGKVWSAEQGRGPVSHPDLASVLERPAVKAALPIADEMQANNGLTKPTGQPANIPDDQWALLKAAAERQGIKLPDQTATGPTLQDLHYAKLALDDMKRTGIERGPGAGGVGYNRAKAIGSAQQALLKVMDDWSPDYGKARGIHADNMSIKNAAELGSDHWTRDPAESAALLKEMTPGEQAVYKSTAFDKWAQRVENGPEDVSKAQSRPLNTARLRSLFPDDASFGKFQEGLQHEAAMHATNKGVMSGSNTADKFADMADMAGVSLPDVFKAMKGNPLPMMAKGVKSIVGPRLRAGAENLAAERARLLTAGADGNAGARAQAVQKMTPGSLMAAITGPRALPPDHDPMLPEVLDPRRGVNRQPPSLAAQAVRQQVDAMTKPSQRVVGTPGVRPATISAKPAAPEAKFPIEDGPFVRAPEGIPPKSLKDFSETWKDVPHDVSERGDLVRLSRVVVPEESRSTGIGSRFMRDLTAYADANGKRIALSPSTDFGASSVARLKKFYARFGFKDNVGRSRDLSVSESMIRDPQGR